MPIAIDGEVYDELSYTAKLLGIELPKQDSTPAEAPGEAQTQGGTQVPASENNASAGNVLGKRGIVDSLLGTTGERYQTWPEKTVRSAVSALALPGDVYSGKVQAGSPQEIERAMDLAGLMVMAPAPVASKMADGTLGSFAGVRSKTIPKDQLKAAQDLETQGVSADDIWKQAGFYRDKSDNRWRYEISDDNAKLTDRDWKFGDIGKLSEFFDHPDLYKAYPQLKDTNFKVDDLGKRNLGGYNPETNTIHINPQALGGNDGAITDTILHELQHRIQSEEGFTSGSSPAREAKKALGALQKVIGETSVNDPKFSELSKLYTDLMFGNNGKENFWNYLYTRNPGEIEANQVIVRKKMTPEERRRISPERLQETLAHLGYKDDVAHQKARLPFYYPK